MEMGGISQEQNFHKVIVGGCSYLEFGPTHHLYHYISTHNHLFPLSTQAQSFDTFLPNRLQTVVPQQESFLHGSPSSHPFRLY
jgi:hypothetical protein